MKSQIGTSVHINNLIDIHLSKHIKILDFVHFRYGTWSFLRKKNEEEDV